MREGGEEECILESSDMGDRIATVIGSDMKQLQLRHLCMSATFVLVSGFCLRVRYYYQYI